MYGAGAKKLAQTLGKPEGMGARLKKDFYKAHPGIEALIKDLERAFDVRGYIHGLDGRPLFIREKRKLLNSLLQNAATMVFKHWMVVCDESTGATTLQVIAYHDELQYEVHGDERGATNWGAVVCKLAERVGKQLGVLVPVEAEAKQGKSWSDCH